MGCGLFGGWAAEEQAGGMQGGTEEAAAEEEAAVQEAAAAVQQHQAQQAQQAQQKVSLTDLFSGVWLLEGEGGEEDGAAAAGGDEDWDAPPPEEEEEAAAAAAADAASAGAGAASTAAATTAAAGPEKLLSLPADEELPGGVGECFPADAAGKVSTCRGEVPVPPMHWGGQQFFYLALCCSWCHETRPITTHSSVSKPPYRR